MRASGQDPSEVLSDLHDAVDAVFEVLVDHKDWGPSGNRDDQYASDVVADQAIRNVLEPGGYGLLSEEAAMVSARDGCPMVVVDPIDGSTNASRGLPWFSTSLCAVDSDGPWVAVVADLVSGTRYDAVRGWGARCDGEEICREDAPPLEESLIAVSGLPARDLGWAQFRNLGSAALALCSVADGRLDGFVDCTTDAHAVWDYLGGLLVCSEAGGVVVDILGRDLCVLDQDARRTPVAGASQTLTDALVESRRSF